MFSKKEMVHTIVAFLIMLGFFFFLTWLVTKDFDEAKGDEGFVTYEELRMYDHDIQTKEGGFFDLWNDSKRQDQRIQNNWEYINSVDARLHRLEIQSRVQPKQTLVAMVSNENGQSYSFDDGRGKEKTCRPVHTKRENFETSALKQYMEYAYQLGGMPFVLMLNAENGSRDPHRQSAVPDTRPGMGANGKEDSWGFCQLHRRRHAYVVDDKRFWDDWRRQMRECHRKFVGGTRFYGADVKHQRGGNIIEVCE